MNLKRHFRLNLGLRVRLFELVAIALLPAFFLIVYHSEEQRHKAVADAANAAQRYARFVASDMHRIIDSAGHLLMALAQLPEFQNADRDACKQIFSQIIGEYRMYGDLGVANRDGRILCSASPPELRSRIGDLLDSNGAPQRLVVGNYHVSQRSGRAGLNLGFPIRRGDEIVGLAYLELDLAWLSQIAKIADLPEGSTITLYDRKGTILFQFPDNPGFAGRTVGDAAIPKGIAGSRKELTNESPLDGQDRIFGLWSLGGGSQEPWIVTRVGLLKEVALADADWYFKRNLLALSLVAILALLIAWYVGDILFVRQLKSLAKTTAKIGAGDFSARTGLSRRNNELDRFARTLDSMAELLQQRDQEAKAAKERSQRQLERINALHEIDMAISSTLDLCDVLNLLLEKIELVLPGAASTIRLLNQKKGGLEPFICRNVDEKVWRAGSRSDLSGLAKMVLENRIPLTVANVQSDARSTEGELDTQLGFVSYLGIPLIVARESLGVIGFYTREEHAFNDDEIEYLTALAGQTAVAIHNAKLFAETRRREREASALHGIAAAASKSLDLDVILNEAVGKISANFNFDSSHVLLLNPQTDLLELRATHSDARVSSLNEALWRGGQSFLHEVVESGQVVDIDDVLANLHYRERLGLGGEQVTGPRFFALHPLKTKLKNWGVAVFCGRDPRRLDDNESRLLESMTHQIGVAVENAMLHKQTVDKANELATLYSFTALASESLDIHLLLRQTTEKLLEMFRFDAVRVFLREGSNDAVVLAAHFGFPSGVSLRDRYHAGEGRIGGVMNSGNPMFVPDMINDVSYWSNAQNQEMVELGYRSSFLMPINAAGRCLGVMNFLCRRPYHFSTSDVQLIQAAAYHLGNAVGNANLYSEIQRKSHELEIANKAKDEFLGVISHELRTPLGIIKGYADILKQKVFGDVTKKQASALDKIMTQATALTDMINDVLQVTAIGAMKTRLSCTDVDLVSLLSELRESYQFANDKFIDVGWTVDGDLPVIFTDVEKLRAILQNLINNALKFTETGSIKITAQKLSLGNGVELSVRDTGVGIPADKIDTIFGMFQQADNSTTRGYGGVGLGLYIVKSFTELLGGRVSVWSEIGKGTCFTVNLPLNAHAGTVDAEPPGLVRVQAVPAIEPAALT
jgi:signal transduction histidine kinase